ncbi:type IV secretion system protein VirB10 [Microvirga alba]|uniref:Type IV secretion system protein VirB10 n=1 Tax=Microvirga alba TaxID=2791025 RepID=A0A931FSH2_9HYPH|nr:type IV secretion system protein VirB10 [Microvirga alba]MBF9235613.1 type IV secretion system protein VirB10 [Microvirga alba]
MSEKDDNGFSLEGDRGIATATGAKAQLGKMKLLAVVIGGVGLSVAALLFVGSGGKEPINTGPKTVIRQSSEFVPAVLPITPVAALPMVPMPSPAQQETRVENDKLLTASRKAPITAFNRGSTKPGGGPSDPVAPRGPEERSDLDTKLTPTRLEGVRAGILGNRDFIITQGTSIPCVLETAMSSDQPGFVTCIITRDILSDNGRVVLLDRNTKVMGEYRGGIKQGQKRMFVLWTRATTPKGVVVALASPGTDPLGRAGFDGEIDTHWWERFGSSMVLSLVDDAAGIMANRLTGGQSNSGGYNNQNNFQNTQSSGKDAAAIAVQESINIPPTLTKSQGELVNILVARDLDFSTIYGLKITEGRTKIIDRAATGDFERYTGVARQ